MDARHLVLLLRPGRELARALVARPVLSFDVVTGAFSYTGRAIAERLLAGGREVRTLSRSPAPPGSAIASAPLQFADPAALADFLRGADVLYNTYWIRFPHGETTYERAVANTRVLLAAAVRAGVRRFVHLSVTNPSEDSPFPYFRGKAAVERDVRESGLSNAIVRPTLVFGPEDVLVNNIAWLVRRLPVFLIPARGGYRVQPISVTDVARIAVELGEGTEDVTVDAAGLEEYAFEELVRLVAEATRARARIVHAPPGVALALVRVFDLFARDVLLTREELDALAASTLVSDEPPRGADSFRAWLSEHGDALGRRYVSELARNFRPYAPV